MTYLKISESQRDHNGVEGPSDAEHHRSKRGVIDGGLRALWTGFGKELLKRSFSAAATALRTIAGKIFTKAVRSVAAAEEEVVAQEVAHGVDTAERVAEEEAVHDAGAAARTAEQEVLETPVNSQTNDNIWSSNDVGNTNIDVFNDIGNTEIEISNDVGNSNIDFFNDLGNINIDEADGLHSLTGTNDNIAFTYNELPNNDIEIVNLPQSSYRDYYHTEFRL